VAILRWSIWALLVSTFAAAFPTLALATSCALAVKFRTASPMGKLGLIKPTLGQGQGIGVFVELGLMSAMSMRVLPVFALHQLHKRSCCSTNVS
jgi:hypothetical protein